MTQVVTGNHAVSNGVKLCRPEVISAYPITPQTSVIEELANMCASKEIKGKFIKVESEHSAMAGCIGASMGGARTFTATSAQGLALMCEMLHWAVGSRLPIVLANINRAMAPPWSIWTDQNDSLSQRDVGWMQFYCESNQEVLDTVIQAYKVAEQVNLPAMLVLDAFFLSHTYEGVEIPEQELVDDYLPEFDPEYKLDVEDPKAFGNIAFPDNYYELRYKIQEAMEDALDVIEESDKEFEEITGRGYGLIEEYKADGAEILFVTSGTVTSTTRGVVDELREKGEKVGLVKIRVLRPFPFERIKEAFSEAEKVAVIDRNIGFGHHGIFYQEIKSALFDEEETPEIFGYIAGLGGRDITPDTITEIYDKTRKRDAQEENKTWIGLKR